MNKIKKVLPLLMVVSLLLLPVLVSAQLVDPGSALGEEGLTQTEITNFINSLASLIIIIGVILAVISIVIGGVLYAVAGGNEDRVNTAKAWLKNGLIAAAIIFGVGVLLNTMRNIVTRQFF